MKNSMTLYNDEGERLYLTPEERKAFLDAACKAPRTVRTLCHVLVYTGGRISEVLALPYGRIDLSSKEIIILTLKKRKKLYAKPQYRAVPVPDY